MTCPHCGSDETRFDPMASFENGYGEVRHCLKCQGEFEVGEFEEEDDEYDEADW